MKDKIINFKVMGDERGSLVAFEENHNVPFYIYGAQKDMPRGGRHSHNNFLRLLMVNIELPWVVAMKKTKASRFIKQT